MRGGPPPGWNGPRGGGMMMGRGPSGPAPPSYDNDIDNYYSGDADYMPPPMVMGGSRSTTPRGASPAPPPDGPIGQAIEMDERHGISSPTQQASYGLRDSDGDVAGIVALQQARASPLHDHVRPARDNTVDGYNDERNSSQK